jgi:putative membrane protein
MSQKSEEDRILVLCVDRDGDIEFKTENATPLLGRKENLDAAIALVLKDSEEPDANAMFESVKIYDQLKKQGHPNEDIQIATISGLQLLGIEADRKLVRELTEVLKKFPADSVILVTDGYSDEAVLPLIESRVAVTSVRRVVIRHSERIEETAALIGKYFRLLTENPRYSRIALGIPGLLLVILAIMSLISLAAALIAFLIVVGGFLFVKGFGVDKTMIKLFRWIREYEPPSLPVQIESYAFAAGIIAVAVGVFLGFNEVANVYLQYLPETLDQWVVLLPLFTGIFIRQGIFLVVFGICVILSARTIHWYFGHDVRLLRTLVIIIVIAWSANIFHQVSFILIYPTAGGESGQELVFSIFIGILLAIAASLVALATHMKYRSFFKKRKKHIEEEFGQS